MKIGSHVSFSGTGLLNAAEEAIGYGATAFMIYTGAPQNTRRKPMEEQFVREGLALMKKHGIEDIVVHAPYIINLASYKLNIFTLAVEFLQSEIERTEFLGQDGISIVLHPGAFTDKDANYGIKRIAEGLNEVLSHKAKVNIALETMAGKGSEIGRRFEELAAIMDKVTHNDRLRVCFDTCHVHDAGYDIVNDFDGVLNEFDRFLGLDRISVFHINDSKNFRGAGKDRHAPLGAGLIGFDSLHHVVHHEAALGKPVILETPWIGKEKQTQQPMYEAEIALLRRDSRERFGAEFAVDVARIAKLFEKLGVDGPAGEPGAAQGGISVRTRRRFVVETWASLQTKKARDEDKREPMERLYDLLLEHGLFPDYSEQQINHRLVGWFAGV